MGLEVIEGVTLPDPPSGCRWRITKKNSNYNWLKLEVHRWYGWKEVHAVSYHVSTYTPTLNANINEAATTILNVVAKRQQQVKHFGVYR